MKNDRVLLQERWELAVTRIRQIAESPEVSGEFGEYFRSAANFLLLELFFVLGAFDLFLRCLLKSCSLTFFDLDDALLARLTILCCRFLRSVCRAPLGRFYAIGRLRRFSVAFSLLFTLDPRFILADELAGFRLNGQKLPVLAHRSLSHLLNAVVDEKIFAASPRGVIRKLIHLAAGSFNLIKSPIRFFPRHDRACRKPIDHRLILNCGDVWIKRKGAD